MLTVQPYNTVSTDKLFDFFKQAKLSNEPASVNMFSDNWETESNTLPYKLFVEKLYDNGLFNVALDNGEIVACSGCYPSKFHSSVLLCGSRTWVNKDYRARYVSTEYLLPEEKKWAKENDFKVVALSFNEYNKNIIKAMSRNGLGYKRTVKGEKHMLSSNMNVVPFPVTIQYTKQYVIYEKLTDWDFDWESIRYNLNDCSL
jgi:hypothetical protein